MPDPKTNEWNLLKDQFNALVHDETVHEDSIEKFLDEQIRRRFGEFINWAAPSGVCGARLARWNRAGTDRTQPC